jgi:hypothetical protein
MNQLKESDSVNLFWTGGWDSTFRLMQLILVEKKNVYPYYIIDHERKSTGIEVYTMGVIRESIKKHFPQAEKYLHPTFYYSLEHIEQDLKINGAWNRLNTHFHVGTQYDWLQRFSKQFELDSIDVALFKDANVSTSPPFRQWYNAFITDNQLPESAHQKEIIEDLGVLFKRFNFPLMSMVKTEMLEIAKQKGWMPVMKNTRFCHRPSVNIKPCGICIPCRQVVGDGMGWRIPFTSKLNRWAYRYKVFLKHDILRR